MKNGMRFEDAMKWIEENELMDDEYTEIHEETEEEYGFIILYFGDWEIRNGKIYRNF